MDEKHDLTIAGFDPYRDSADYYYDHEAGQAVIDFGARYLVHAVGRWQSQPFRLEEWQRRLILNLFGWKHKQTGLRRFRNLFFSCARKGGKSTLCALITWWMFAADKEQPHCYLCANSTNQARNLWDTVCFQLQNPKLGKRYKQIGQRITSKSRNGFIQLISSAGKTAHGSSPSLVIFDEQSWSTKNELHTAMSTGFGAREQPIWVTCSTVSHITDNAFAESLEHAKRVRDGAVSDPSFLAVLYVVPADGEKVIIDGEEIEVSWHDRRCWGLANPNLHIGLPNDLESEYAKALSMPSFANEFRMTKLNQSVASKTVWLPLHEWDKQQHDFPADLTETPCCLGVDISTSQDITSFCASWFVDGVLHLQPFFIIPEDNIDERERLHKVPYSKWAADPKNNLFLTEGNSVDYPFVTSKILEFCESHNVENIYFDRYKWSSVIGGLMLQGKECTAHGQDFASMSSPCHEFERLVLTHKVNCRNPVFRWMIAHCSIKTDEGGRIRPIKPQHKDHKKIDAIAAALMTVTHHTTVTSKVYDFNLK